MVSTMTIEKDLVVTIVEYLAKGAHQGGASRGNFSCSDWATLSRKVRELMQYDSDEFVRGVLKALKGSSALDPSLVQELRNK
jgi:hypothetical protein